MSDIASYRRILRSIIHSNTRDNALQPSKSQIRQLSKLVDDEWDWWKTLTWTEWFELLNEDVMFGHRRDLITDQKNRAKAIVDKMIETGRNRVMMMDGHGREVYCIVEAITLAQSSGHLPGNFLDEKFELVLIDLDPVVDEWHRLFFSFSKYVKTYLGNIHDFQDKFLSKSSIKKTIVYHNFCGTGQTTPNGGPQKFVRKRYFGNDSKAPLWCLSNTILKPWLISPIANGHLAEEDIEKLYGKNVELAREQLKEVCKRMKLRSGPELRDMLWLILGHVDNAYYATPDIELEFIAKLLSQNVEGALESFFVSFSTARRASDGKRRHMAVRRLYRVCEALGVNISVRANFQSYYFVMSKVVDALGTTKNALRKMSYDEILGELLDFDSRNPFKKRVLENEVNISTPRFRKKAKAVRRGKTTRRKRKSRRSTGMSEKDFFKMCHQTDKEVLSRKRARKRV